MEKVDKKTPGKGVRFEEDTNLMKPASVSNTKKNASLSLLPAPPSSESLLASPLSSSAKRLRGQKGIIVED